MFFSDGNEAGVDTGASGFLNIFSDAASTETPTDSQTAADTTIDADSQAGATAADTSEPSGADDGQYTDADDVVAARFAASLEADGIETPEPGEEQDVEAAPEEGAFDFESLTPAELRALAEEAIALKAEKGQTDEQALVATVKAKVEEAEANAVAAVTRQYETEVLTTSRNHYAAQLNQRVAGIVRAAKNQDDPDAYITQQTIAAAHAVFDARTEWEAKQAQDWDQHAVDAALEARKRVPELRDLYARRLATELNLPEQAVADIAHANRDIDHFRQRAEELVGLAKALGTERKKSNQKKRTDANRELQEAPIRTSSTGRQPGGKVPAYKGTADEGMRILSLMHTGN